MTRVAIDTGGTFTDLVARRPDGTTYRLKVPSTPADPSVAIGRALSALGELIGEGFTYTLRHGTTVATNAVLERRGSRVALITNQGFEDILWLRRQARPGLYDLHPQNRPALLDRADVVGIRGRRSATGELIEPLEDLNGWLDANHQTLSRVDAICVCLLHAYQNSSDEIAIQRALSARYPQIPICLSSHIAPVPQEFERASTVCINAFVAPVMHSYLSRLAHLNDDMTELSIMGSSGSLMTSAEAEDHAVKTVLSGPAGGVRGAWCVGQRCDRQELLTVDMGGTSTDVSIVSGDLLPTNEGRVGQHPVRIPVLPIETVGAGGGSIAFVDAGGALRVGPESAGAIPGPACYGHPDADRATVTDANVVLGRIDTLLGGEFELHIDAARSAIARLAQQIDTSIEETAASILRIAEANMVRACKQVIIDQGANPESLTLVAFGGAGGLHACALAASLGCRDVLFPAEPGVLSALGILDAPHEVSRTQTILLAEDQWSSPRIQARIQGIGAGMTDAAESAPTYIADCRYSGQTWTLPVKVTSVSTPSDLRSEFESSHTQRYGYHLGPDREIEWVTLRAFFRSEIPGSSVRVHQDDIPTLEGPRRISSYSATLFVPSGWRAQRLESGDYLCTRISDHEDAPHGVATDFEVHRQRMVSIAEEMGATLMQAAFSANIKERRDLSCAVFDRRGQLLCHAAHIPVHLGSTPLSVRAAMEDIEFRPGVSAFLNDPYRGGTHLPDVTVVSPVFAPGVTEPVFYVANRAHHADVGGRLPGSLTPLRGVDGQLTSLTIDDEGVRIPPTELTDDSRAAFANASRLPEERFGDLRAQEAANFVGAERLDEWLSSHSLKTLEASNEALMEYSERLMRATLRQLPDGQYAFTDYLDGDGSGSGPIALPVLLTIAGDQSTVDFSAAQDAVEGPINAVRAIVLSAVFYCFRCLAGDAIPANEGLMRPLTVITRPGSFLDARPPSAVAAGNVETSQRLVDALFGALAQAAPERIPAASAGSMNNVLFGGTDIRGKSPRAFVHYETLAGGAGAGPMGPGADGIQLHMTNTLNTPVEVLERLFPVVIEEYALDTSHAGKIGEHRGGRGVVRAYRFLQPATVTLMTDRRTTVPWGLNGASNGQPGRNEVVRRDGSIERLVAKTAISVHAGECIRITTPSGGAWRPLVNDDRFNGLQFDPNGSSDSPKIYPTN